LSKNTSSQLFTEFCFTFLAGIGMPFVSLINTFLFILVQMSIAGSVITPIYLAFPHPLYLTQPKPIWAAPILEYFLCIVLLLSILIANSALWILIGHRFDKATTKFSIYSTVKKNWHYVIKTLFYWIGMALMFIIAIKTEGGPILSGFTLGITVLAKLFNIQACMPYFQESPFNINLMFSALFLFIPLVMFWLGFIGEYFKLFDSIIEIFNRFSERYKLKRIYGRVN
jgi:hypothetical protein